MMKSHSEAESGNDEMQYIFIPVGTAVSAKFRGAFCEARVTDCQQKLRYKIIINGTNTAVSHDSTSVEAMRPKSDSCAAKSAADNKGSGAVEILPTNSQVRIETTGQTGTVVKFIDASQYTVVFDDGDQSTFNRRAIKIKGQKYFNNEDNLNTLPLIDPERFGNQQPSSSSPLQQQGLADKASDSNINRRSRSQNQCSGADDKTDNATTAALLFSASLYLTSESESCLEDSMSSTAEDDTEANSSSNVNNWIFNHLDQVVWIDIKKGCFPGLVVDPWETDKKRDADNHCIVKSFRNDRYYSIPFKYVEEFDAAAVQSDKPQLQAAIDIANAYLSKNTLPKNWIITYRQIYKDIVECLGDNSLPERVTVGPFSIEMGRLFFAVWRLGGFEAVSQMKQWTALYKCVSRTSSSWGSTPSPLFVSRMKNEYKKHLIKYESEFESRLGANEDNPLPTLSTLLRMNKQTKQQQQSPPNMMKTEIDIKLDQSTTYPVQLATQPRLSFRSVDDFIEVNFRDGQIYPAKILKIDTTRDHECGIYFVHYKNWNSRHDEWIEEDRIVGSSSCNKSSSEDFSFNNASSAVDPEPQIHFLKKGSNHDPPEVEVANDALATIEPNCIDSIENQSTLSKVLAEKRILLQQNSTSDGIEMSSVKSKSSKSPQVSPSKDKNNLQRNKEASSSSEDDSSLTNACNRTPRKRRRRISQNKSNTQTPVKEVSKVCSEKKSDMENITAGKLATLNELKLLEQPEDNRVCDQSSQHACDASSTQSKTSSLQRAPNTSLHRSPPKRRRVVKRSSLSECGKSNSPSASKLKLNTSVTSRFSSTPKSNTECGKMNECCVEGTDLCDDTNDEGFSADEECESDDTIDMNKYVPEGNEFIPTEASFLTHQQGGQSELGTVSESVKTQSASQSVSPKNDTDLNAIEVENESPVEFSPRITRSSVLKMENALNSSSETNTSSKCKNVAPCVVKTPIASTEDIKLVSPSLEESSLSKRGRYNLELNSSVTSSKMDTYGTPTSNRKTAKRKNNGKSGQYRHGFFISDQEDSEIDELASSSNFSSEIGLNCPSGGNAEKPDSGQSQLPNFYAVFNCEQNGEERILDVSVLDDISDIDERIAVAEEQMNLIQKRYKQLYREMEKLDNLKRRLRKRKKLSTKQTHLANRNKFVSIDQGSSVGKNEPCVPDIVSSNRPPSECEASSSAVSNCNQIQVEQTTSSADAAADTSENLSRTNIEVGVPEGEPSNDIGKIHDQYSDYNETPVVDGTSAGDCVGNDTDGGNNRRESIDDGQLNAVELLISLQN